MKCPKCQSTQKQCRAGFNPSGSQRYRCGECHRVYTPEPQTRGYAMEMRMLTIRMLAEGSSQRGISRTLKVSPQTVGNWINAHRNQSPVDQSSEPTEKIPTS